MENKEEEDVVLDDDIRRINFWKNYLRPSSPTYSNAKQSALKAGYKPGYAANITTEKFFKRKLRRLNLLNKAEKVLDESLEAKHIDESGKIDAATLRVKVDSAKFVAKTLGKDEGYTERAELTGKNGTPVIVMPPELINKFNLNDLQNKSEVLLDNNKEDDKEEE